MTIHAVIVPIDDVVIAGEECACVFSEYDDEDFGEESWHFKRRCKCGHTWYGLHCPHDGYQNPCPECSAVPNVIV